MLVINSNAAFGSATLETGSRNEQPLRRESLPFTIRVVSNVDDLEKAIRIRHAAYMRHVPQFAAGLRKPETMDSERGVIVLLAESKLDGSPIGTMRIQTNDFAPLSLEQAVPLPSWLGGKRLAEATRLGVTHERVGRMVTMALFKAFYLYCQKQRVDWMVIAARSPVDRHYDRLLFKDCHPDSGYVPFKHVANLPHRVMSLETAKAHEQWLEAKHPLLSFMVHTYHKDIDVGTTTIYQPGITPFERARVAAVMTA